MTFDRDVFYLQSALACAGVAVITDLRSRRIPNWLTGPTFLLGLAMHFALGGSRQLELSALSALLAGGLFFVLFQAGGMGAGDVKLMAAVASLAGLQSLRSMLIVTVLLGAVAAIVVALVNGRLRETWSNSCALIAHHQAQGLVSHPQLNVKNQAMLRLPYALPIAGGCLTALLIELHGGFVL